jgi:hypothetical protein
VYQFLQEAAAVQDDDNNNWGDAVVAGD